MDLELIRELSNASGAPGFEDDVVEVLRKASGEIAFESDALKNSYFNLTGQDNLIMLDAHADEVAFIVRNIDEDGLIQFLPLGAWVPSSVPAHLVKVKGFDGYYEGVVAQKPIHFMSNEERNKELDLDDLRIDMGGYSKEELEELGIRVGSPIVPSVNFEVNEKTGLMRGKAFDNRLGAAAVVHVIREVVKKGIKGVVGTVASQEEVGGRGAVVTAKKVKPKYAIVFEGSPSDDFFVKEHQRQCRLKGGPQVRHYDGSYISSTYLLDIAEKVSKEKKINIQHAVRKGSGTNAGPIHVQNEGIECLVIGIPSRYIHSHYSYASLKDFEDVVEFAVGVIEELTK